MSDLVTQFAKQLGVKALHYDGFEKVLAGEAEGAPATQFCSVTCRLWLVCVRPARRCTTMASKRCQQVRQGGASAVGQFLSVQLQRASGYCSRLSSSLLLIHLTCRCHWQG